MGLIKEQDLEAIRRDITNLSVNLICALTSRTKFAFAGMQCHIAGTNLNSETKSQGRLGRQQPGH